MGTVRKVDDFKNFRNRRKRMEGKGAYAAETTGKWSIVVAGKEISGGHDDAPEALVFSPDGKRIGYTAKNGQRWVVFVDGKAGPEYVETSAPVFSSDGKRVAYAAKQGLKWLVVVDGKAGPPEYEDNAKPVFSRDGRHLAYAAKKAAVTPAVACHTTVNSIRRDGVKGEQDNHGSKITIAPGFGLM